MNLTGQVKGKKKVLNKFKSLDETKINALKKKMTSLTPQNHDIIKEESSLT